MIWSGAAWALLSATLGFGLAVPAKRATVCNGHPELCTRSYGNVTFAGAHDSFASSTDPLALAADQEIDITAQLNSGIRLLQAQSHVENGVLHFCHTSCALFDGGTVAAYLATVKSWLDSNPNEVLTLLFTNPESQSVQTVWDPLFKGAGIDQLALVPSTSPAPIKQSDWPTLGDMIDSGKRVVVFLDAGADETTVPYILDEFQFVWETPFDSTDATFPCSVDRINTDNLAQTDHLALINHFLDQDIFGIDIPNKGKASTTNGIASISANAAGCAPLNAGRNPNFVLMDWVDIGAPIAAIDQLNGFAS
ncbi:hypothetical protein M422DRAFT_25035 [Sphaerobolus stellatus SS14]|nr:hypothetical protein M422DRAFT_25035 [Sphaerobolus stellatus SS14]